MDRCIDSLQTNNTKSCRVEAGDRRDGVSKINKQNHENIVALTDEACLTSATPPFWTVCPVHTKSINFWPIINQISHMDNSNSSCQLRNLIPLNALFQKHISFSWKVSNELLTNALQEKSSYQMCVCY